MHLPTCTKHAGPSTTGDTSPLSSKRKSCNRSTSPYFGTALTTGIPSGSGARRESRSRHFKSSPDSCHGSAISFDWGSAFTERAFVALKACKQFEKLGVRHICRNKCYFRAYEPFRKWHALRLKVAATGSSTRVLAGWSVQMDGGQEARLPWRIKYVSPDGTEYTSMKPVLDAVGLGQQRETECPMPPQTAVRRRIGSPQQAPTACTTIMYPDGPAYLLKEPSAGAFPPSPFGLIEELLAEDPWKLLVGCIMLNQTTRSQMDKVLWEFLEKFPTAKNAAAASVEEITHVVAPLGLQERRPAAIVRFSQEYLSKSWKNTQELYWIGKYASDAHKIFVERKWREVQPNDHALNWWVEWMRGTQPGARVSPPRLEKLMDLF